MTAPVLMPATAPVERPEGAGVVVWWGLVVVVVAEFDDAVGRVVAVVVVDEIPNVDLNIGRLRSHYTIRCGMIRELTGPDLCVALTKLKASELFLNPCASTDAR